MATYQEHRQNTGSMLIALNRVSRHATPAEINAAIDEALANQEIEAMATELLYRLGAGPIHYPAAA